jgi:hypothetical protein
MQELLRGYEERIVLENAADDDQRVRAHDINHRVSAESRKMVRADDRIIVAAPHIIDPRFKLNQIVDVRLTVRQPVHAADNTIQGKSSLGIAARHLLERVQHAILIEPTVSKVGFRAAPKLELAASLDSGRVDSYAGQSLQVVTVLIWTNDVNRLVSTREPILNERQ